MRNQISAMPPKTKKQKIENMLETEHEIIHIPGRLLRCNSGVFRVTLVKRDGKKYLCHFDGNAKARSVWMDEKYV